MFFTKKESTPDQYECLLDAALRLKERSLANLPIEESEDVPLSIWELEAFLIFERVERIFSNQKWEREEAERENNPNGEKKNRGRAYRPGKKTNSSAFDYSDEQLRQMYLDKKKLDERRKNRRKTALRPGQKAE